VSKKVVALVGVLALLVLSAGCGSGDDNSLTKAEFVKQADAICKKGEKKKNDSLVSAYKKVGSENKESKNAQEEIIVDVALPPISKMIEELDGLGALNGEEEKAERMVEAFEEEAENVEEDPAGTIAGKVGNFDEANKIAKELGMEDCSAI